MLRTLIFGLVGAMAATLLFAKSSNQTCVFVISNKGCVFAETVNTPAMRAKGLGGRPSMAANHAMLFEFNKPGGYCFWMKEMKFDLDIIWLNHEKHIVDIKPNVSPNTYPMAFCPVQASQYVIEVNSGVAKEANLIVGHKLSF